MNNDLVRVALGNGRIVTMPRAVYESFRSRQHYITLCQENMIRLQTRWFGHFPSVLFDGLDARQARNARKQYRQLKLRAA